MDTDIDTFKELGLAMRRAALACGLEPNDVRALAPGVAEIAGTGVAIFLTSHTERGVPVWVVRETHELPGQDKPAIVQTSATIPEAEFTRAAKCAIMLVMERRIDLALSVQR